MRKLHKAAVVVAMVGATGFLGAGTAFAGGPGIDVHQNVTCTSHDLNLNLLGNLSGLNGALAGAVNGEGEAGTSNQHVGSEMACSANAFTQ